MANPTIPPSTSSKIVDYDDMYIKAEGFIVNGKVLLADQSSNIIDVASATASNPTAPAALSQAAAPAGGTGATAGAYDGASNRDLMIASVNAARDDIIALRTEVVSYEVAISALIVDVALHRTAINAILAALEAHGLMAE